MKRSLLIKLIKGSTLWITGEYYKEEPEVGLPERFEICSVESQEKDIFDLLEFANYEPKGTLLDTLEHLCLKEINNDN